jgi:hypothetical protein
MGSKPSPLLSGFDQYPESDSGRALIVSVGDDLVQVNRPVSHAQSLPRRIQGSYAAGQVGSAPRTDAGSLRAAPPRRLRVRVEVGRVPRAGVDGRPAACSEPSISPSPTMSWGSATDAAPPRSSAPPVRGWRGGDPARPPGRSVRASRAGRCCCRGAGSVRGRSASTRGDGAAAVPEPKRLVAVDAEPYGACQLAYS